jgi:hypothetical protein
MEVASHPLDGRATKRMFWLHSGRHPLTWPDFASVGPFSLGRNNPQSDSFRGKEKNTYAANSTSSGNRRLIAGAMVDQFVFQIDWVIVAAVIGLLVSSVALFLYARRDRD